MYPSNKLSFGYDVEYTICTECGLIIESYVENQRNIRGHFRCSSSNGYKSLR